MSWNKKQFKDKYNRGNEPDGWESLTESEEDQDWLDDTAWHDYDAKLEQTTMKDISQNYLMHVLNKLGLRRAKELLSYFWR
jgi:hypothetical protein